MLCQLPAKLLQIFFDQLYHRFAWAYDWVAAVVSLGRWYDWVFSTLPYLEAHSILEIGHGTGHLQRVLHQRGCFVCGLDESYSMSRLAVARLRKDGLVPMLTNGIAQHLPFGAGLFEIVVVTFPTQYIVHPRTLAEIHRVLAPGGRLVVLPVAWIRGRARLERLAAWLFIVTGQSPHWDERFILPFQEAGFRVQVIREFVRNSEVLIIVAERSKVSQRYG